MTDDPKFTLGRIEAEDWVAFHDAPVFGPIASNGSGSHVDDVEAEEPSESEPPTLESEPTIPAREAEQEADLDNASSPLNGIEDDSGRLGIDIADSERLDLRVLAMALFDEGGSALAQRLTRDHFAAGRARMLFAITVTWYRVDQTPIEPAVLESRLIDAGRSAMEARQLVLALQNAWVSAVGQDPSKLIDELEHRAAKSKQSEMILAARAALTPPRFEPQTALKLLERVLEPSNDNAAKGATRPRYLPLPEAIMRSMVPLGPRMATSIETLDVATVGGLPLSSVAIFCGAPGSAKSGLAVYLVHRFEKQGAVCMYLAADEPARGILTRLGQLEGFERTDLSSGGIRGEQTRQSFAARVRDRSCMTIVVDPAYDGARTIEEAHAELVALAGDRPRVLVIDSLQRARCLAADACNDPRAKVNAKLDLLREQANGGTLIILLSEMGRASYDIDAERNPLAAGKESGAVEYDADLQINLYSVKDQTGMIDAVIAKSRFSADRPRFRLRLDFARASFSEVAADAAAASGVPVDRSAARAAASKARKELETDALARQLSELVTRFSEKGTNELRRIAAEKLGWGITNFRRAEARLKDGLEGRRLVDASDHPNACKWVMAVDPNHHDEGAS